MPETELTGITTYVQLIEVMRKVLDQLVRDLEVTENKVPILKANLVRVERALLVLEKPLKRYVGKPHEWTPEQRAAAAERMRKMNEVRRAEKVAAGRNS